MFLPELSSFVAAVLFAVHPIHTEAVSARLNYPPVFLALTPFARLSNKDRSFFVIYEAHNAGPLTNKRSGDPLSPLLRRRVQRMAVHHSGGMLGGRRRWADVSGLGR